MINIEQLDLSKENKIFLENVERYWDIKFVLYCPALLIGHNEEKMFNMSPTAESLSITQTQLFSQYMSSSASVYDSLDHVEDLQR